MKACFDCTACLIRQTLDCALFHTDDEAAHEQLLRHVLRMLSRMDLRQSPPVMAQPIHRKIREFTGQGDPYRDLKDRFNRLGLELYPALKARVDASDDPLETAVRLTIAGNVIDCGVRSALSRTEVLTAVQEALTASLNGDVEPFRRAVLTADDVLYVTDNAGQKLQSSERLEQVRERLREAIEEFTNDRSSV